MQAMPYPPGAQPAVFYLYPIGPAPVTQSRELTVDTDTPSATAFTGGSAECWLTVEYLVDSDSTGASVTVTIVSAGATTTWTDTAIAAGYYTTTVGPKLAPGAKLSLQASGAMARLRWCETVCC